MSIYTEQLPQNIMSGFSHIAIARQDGQEIYWDDELNPDYDDPYYVCVIWKNGNKLPLPILLQLPSGDADEQNQIDEQCAILDNMASYSGVMEAKKECNDYLNLVISLDPTANIWAVWAKEQIK